MHNTSSHTAIKTMSFLSSEKVKLVTHPTFSSDLAPCDFLLFSKIKDVMREFKRSHVNLSDEFRDGHSSTAVNNKNIDAVHRMIETDMHMTCHEIGASWGIGSRVTRKLPTGRDKAPRCMWAARRHQGRRISYPPLFLAPRRDGVARAYYTRGSEQITTY
ncbi:hypothetical protein EVAR_102687_1 [Eumeta japonica]|uniref:Histone-lysine N-methyltransferase SETMAR n=1 Tax=Eumeta variegata TaxID=151549 RepID=A0A4C1TIP8_EUMVA|nr:hypothetical protein EVAR_102687_1 [Eumeta japonica]